LPRRQYLTGFRKRKTERSKVAHKAIVDKELREKRSVHTQNVHSLPINLTRALVAVSHFSSGLFL